MSEVSPTPTDTPRIGGLAPKWALGTLVVDVLLVLLFAALGKQSHEASSSFATVLRIVWPFLVGLVAAWAIVHVRGWNIAKPWPAGVTVWLVTYVVGMLLRGLTTDHADKTGLASRGLSPGFLVVAVIFLGIALVGWRSFAAAKMYYRERRTASPIRG